MYNVIYILLTLLLITDSTMATSLNIKIGNDIDHPPPTACSSLSFLWAIITYPLYLTIIASTAMLLISPRTQVLAFDFVWALRPFNIALGRDIERLWDYLVGDSKVVMRHSVVEYRERLRQQAAKIESDLTAERNAAIRERDDAIRERNEARYEYRLAKATISRFASRHGRTDDEISEKNDEIWTLREDVALLQLRLASFRGTEPAMLAQDLQKLHDELIQRDNEIEKRDLALLDTTRTNKSFERTIAFTSKLHEAKSNKYDKICRRIKEVQACEDRLKEQYQEQVDAVKHKLKLQAYAHQRETFYKNQEPHLHKQVLEALFQLSETDGGDTLTIAVMFGTALKQAGIDLFQLCICARRLDVLHGWRWRDTTRMSYSPSSTSVSLHLSADYH